MKTYVLVLRLLGSALVSVLYIAAVTLTGLILLIALNTPLVLAISPDYYIDWATFAINVTTALGSIAPFLISRKRIFRTLRKSLEALKKDKSSLEAINE